MLSFAACSSSLEALVAWWLGRIRRAFHASFSLSSLSLSLFKNFTGSVTLDVVANKIQMFDYFLSKTNLRAKISILCCIPCAGRT